MSLLTDDEEWKLWNAQGIDDMNQAEAIAFARAYAAAILAKLASAELPEPADRFVFSGADWHRATPEYFKQSLGQTNCIAAYSADQLTAWGNTRFAQGAASQLAEKPSAQVEIMGTDINGYQQNMHVVVELVDSETLPVGTKLYTRREA